MKHFKELRISGCIEIQPEKKSDNRGSFVKTFKKTDFELLGLEKIFEEQYYSKSKRGVIRGMHFQEPPFDHAKLVYCVEGEVFDVVLDLRIGSPTYGHAESVIISSERANSIYIPKGVAHGFCCLSENCTLIYNVTSEYVPEKDSGILWSSANIAWPIKNNIISERDMSFKPFAEYDSPFVFNQ